MSRKRPEDDIAFDEHGRTIAIGTAAADGERSIVEHPDATPVLIVARLGDDIGVRVFGKPSDDVANLLDHIASTYRAALKAASGTTQ